MNMWQVMVLGAVQGLTEFLPISSSGHLILAERFLGLPGNFTFDVLLNFGTLVALMWFFRAKIMAIIKQIFIERDLRLALMIVAATIPTGLVGVLLSDQIKSLDSHLWLVVAMLALVGSLMLAAGKTRRMDAHPDKVTWPRALTMGVAQIFALIPGTSRSGSTILAGLNTGLSAKAAAEFSFMMAIPIILAASGKTLLSHEGRAYVSGHLPMVLVGNMVSFICGVLAVKLFINLLGRSGLKGFGYYRLALAGLLAVLIVTQVIK